MHYAALTPRQRAQAAYLFADDLFGTDPSAYLYSVDKGGNITKRRTMTKAPKRTTRARLTQPVQVTLLEEQHLTDELTARAREHFQTFAALLAREIQNQTQEVTA